ncbi:PPC domain-containing DNA-binding protein [Endozoicomonas sp. OPT23]|uniref:PPC domain-containing DNA-binding protein n=1 Tax=Endozoicomonas sp. OPT23 TaxID=2072845 RepID=UPI001E2AC673|nr:PPC domain-containing DNA-binding protein [Endozoicomonas sp. OPT23]
MECYVFRLLPGTDLLQSLKDFLIKEDITAGCILSCAGSLKPSVLRLSDHRKGTRYDFPAEIVSLSGTVSTEGCHLHMSVADEEGRVIGGHVLPGSMVYTTAEIIIGELPKLNFTRQPCSLSGYNELVVTKKPTERS